MLLHFDAKDRKDAESVIAAWIRGGVIPPGNYEIHADDMRITLGSMNPFVAYRKA